MDGKVYNYDVYKKCDDYEKIYNSYIDLDGQVKQRIIKKPKEKEEQNNMPKKLYEKYLQEDGVAATPTNTTTSMSPKGEKHLGAPFAKKKKSPKVLPMQKRKKPLSEEYDEKELEMGKDVEKEHKTTVKKIMSDEIEDKKDAYEEIAKDHLEELPDYYSRLKKMEKEGEEDLKD